jgi:hypothetical protein
MHSSMAIDVEARFGGSAIFNRHKQKTILLFVESIFHYESRGFREKDQLASKSREMNMIEPANADRRQWHGGCSKYSEWSQKV